MAGPVTVCAQAVCAILLPRQRRSVQHAGQVGACCALQEPPRQGWMHAMAGGLYAAGCKGGCMGGRAGARTRLAEACADRLLDEQHREALVP